MSEIFFDITFSIFFLSILYVGFKWSVEDLKREYINK